MFCRLNKAWASGARTGLLHGSSPQQSVRHGLLSQLAGARAFPRFPRSRTYANFRNGSRSGFNRAQFDRTVGFWQRQAARPTFYQECVLFGGVCYGFYYYNLEEVPVTGRRRFRIVSDDYERSAGEQLYQSILQEYRGNILPDNHPLHRFVEGVLDRLVPHAGLSSEQTQWEVHVIANDEKNAFVIPGGKVFVFTGILNVCGSEDGLAAVLGHEIAHNVAHHTAERMSQYGILMPIALVASLLLGLGDLGDVVTRNLVDLCFLRPGGRAQESEADHIGLLMMAEACYDPNAAVELWARMEKMNERSPPEFLSTHPSNYNRMESIRQWLPQAEVKADQSGCEPTRRHVEGFQSALQEM